LSEETRNYSDEELREIYNMPQRAILGVDVNSFGEWEFQPTPIWVVPEPALQWGFDNRHHAYAGNIMILPAEEQEWRDNQHYRAYVRPTKEEENE
jgi:hypothetical protein